MADVSRESLENTPASAAPDTEHVSDAHMDRIENVADGLRELWWISRSLRARGTFTALNALLALGFVVGTGVLRAFPIHREVVVSVAVLGVVCAFQGFYLLFAWERRVDRGMILFEEISDEIEWEHRTNRRADTVKSESKPIREGERPEFKIRCALRDFLKSTKLPLTPDQVGSAGYMVVYVICVVTLIALVPSYWR